MLLRSCVISGMYERTVTFMRCIWEGREGGREEGREGGREGGRGREGERERERERERREREGEGEGGRECALNHHNIYTLIER